MDPNPVSQFKGKYEIPDGGVHPADAEDAGAAAVPDVSR